VIDAQTLQFESGRTLQSLYGNDLTLLKALEKTLEVRVTARDGMLRVEGATDRIEQTRRVFEQLDRARLSGINIRKHEFLQALRAVSEPEESSLDELHDTKILLGLKRPPIVPKTARQRAYLQAIQTHDMVFGVGPAGTGKTYLAVATGVAELQAGLRQRLIVTRPAVEAGEKLGFLPGTLEEKVDPYMLPIWDALRELMGQEQMERRMSRGEIEVAPIAFMRGRTLKNAFVIVDEAQNTTVAQMKMVLTRLGRDSRMVVTGDPGQVDLPGSQPSGLKHALRILGNVEGIAAHHLTAADVVRHGLVSRIIDAYEASGES